VRTLVNGTGASGRASDMVGCVRRILGVAVLVGALAVTVAGCGGGGNHIVAPLTIENAFARHGFVLADTGLYSSSDRPIIRSYLIAGPGHSGGVMAGVLVYSSVRGAVAAKRFHPSGSFIPKNAVRATNSIRRANVILFFWRTATRADRRRMTSTLNSVGP
jgi:hypothetical protein